MLRKKRSIYFQNPGSSEKGLVWDTESKAVDSLSTTPPRMSTPTPPHPTPPRRSTAFDPPPAEASGAPTNGGKP